MVSEVRRRMVPLPRFRVEDDEMEVVLVWVDVDMDDREQWMMKIASRTNIDDEEEEGDDLFGRWGVVAFAVDVVDDGVLVVLRCF